MSAYCNVAFAEDRIYAHRLLRINYTTYDVRRNEDVIHIDTPQSSVMLLNSDYTRATWHSVHPYLYGKCLGVYHANVYFVGCLPDGKHCYTRHRLDFVWVHWYDFVPADKPLALDRLSLIPVDNPTALGFIDPTDVLRGLHVIPCFSQGEAESQPPRSRWAPSLHKTWNTYYINR